MWVSTMFQQIVRDNSSGSEATIVCAAVACVCGVGCALSMCRAAPPPPRAPDRVSSTARREAHLPRQVTYLYIHTPNPQPPAPGSL